MDRFSIDTDRADKLFHVLGEIVDHPLFDDSPRVVLSATLSVTSLDLGASVRTLCASDQMIGANVCLRSQFEALIRSVWALHRATDLQVEKLSAQQLTLDTQQGAKSIPLAAEMLEELGKIPHLAQLTSALNEFKSGAWQPLNSYVHAGLYAVLHTRFGGPPSLFNQIFRISNGFGMLAFNNLGILTGISGIQAEIRAATASFSSVLPDYRNDT